MWNVIRYYILRHSLKQGPRARDPRPRNRDPGPGTRDQGPGTWDPGPKPQDTGLQNLGPGDFELFY